MIGTSCRLKIICVSEFELFKLLPCFTTKNRLVMAMFGTPVPDDAKLLSVHHDHWNKTFCFTLEHPSFPESKPGAPIPIEIIAWQQQRETEDGPFVIPASVS